MKKIKKNQTTNNKPLLDIEGLIPSYPSGDYIVGNFIQVYLANYNILDKKFIRKYGEQSIRFDEDYTETECMQEYNTTIQGIVFSHLEDWAKMYAAMLTEYNPIWNVDGTEVTVYGKTKKTDTLGQRHEEDILGATHTENIHGLKQEQDIIPNYTDTDKTYHATSPDTTERLTDKNSHEFGAHTVDHKTLSYTDQINGNAVTNKHDENQVIDKSENDEHTDTLTRQGNIGVTKSTDLVESEIALRSKYGFFDIIFAIIMREIGGAYYGN